MSIMGVNCLSCYVTARTAIGRGTATLNKKISLLVTWTAPPFMPPHTSPRLVRWLLP